eukprot:SAG22_NODE_183_length_16031_cov_36.647000_9_plen_105_part_00
MAAAPSDCTVSSGGSKVLGKGEFGAVMQVSIISSDGAASNKSSGSSALHNKICALKQVKKKDAVIDLLTGTPLQLNEERYAMPADYSCTAFRVPLSFSPLHKTV